MARKKSISNKLSPLEVKQLLEMYERGEKVSAIKQKFDVANGTICHHVKKHESKSPFSHGRQKLDKVIRKCGTCEHIVRSSSGGGMIYYCSMQRTTRTATGFVKIKAKDAPCEFYQLKPYSDGPTKD